MIKELLINYSKNEKTKSFKKVYESKLASNRFNPYTGWNTINNGIILFVDNIHDKNDSDNLIVDIIHPD